LDLAFWKRTWTRTWTCSLKVDLDLDLRIVDLDLHLDLAVAGLVTSLLKFDGNTENSGQHISTVHVLHVDILSR